MPTVIGPDMRLKGAAFYKLHEFKSGNVVPIYNVFTIESMTQIIGYSKYLNSDYGTVLYRGECKIHDSIIPSIYRYNGSSPATNMHFLKLCIKKALSDQRFSDFSKSANHSSPDQIAESIFQHYGVPTHYIDVVDNHWSALWFGLYKFSVFNGKELFAEYLKREIDFFSINQASALDDESLYQYLICIAVDTKPQAKGFSNSSGEITIDLRSALPSTFLRPHAQHGWVIKKYSGSLNHDLSTNVVSILRMRIDTVNKWLGNGELTSVHHMFPRPAYDYGYDVMLKRFDLFEGTPFKVHYYV